MGSVNHVQLLFSLMTAVIILLGCLINLYEKYIPAILKQTFLYGKFAYKGQASFMKPVQVPKSWFRHFYIFSSMLLLFALFLVVRVYVFQAKPPSWLLQLLDLACGSERRSSTKAPNVVLAVALLNLQCWRRLYDTQFVSVFGKDSRMDLSHYLVGFVHYIGVTAAILGEAPRFAPSSYNAMKWEFSAAQPIAASVFLWAWFHQYKATVILADLRRNKKGNVVTDERKIPQGDWFDYISSPHLTAEILMYFSITILLSANVTWWFVFFWVLSNQVETALLSHWWYRETFADFPKKRRALIPLLY